MIIEISLTRSLAKKLNLHLEPTSDVTPNENHYYADIITRGKQPSVMFFNTLFSWICLAPIKDIRKDFTKTFKEAIKKTLKSEFVRPYLVRDYIGEITGVKLSLTNNKSIVARMNQVKKDLYFFYDEYYGVPNAVELALDQDLNDTLVKNPLSNKPMDYIIPYEEMGYYLEQKYKDEEYERYDLDTYYFLKKKQFPNLEPVIDLSDKSDEELEIYFKSIKEDCYPYFLIPFVRGLYKKYPHPSIEDHYSYIRDTLPLKELDDADEIALFMKAFNLNLDLFLLYLAYTGKEYKTNLKQRFNHLN